MSPESLSEWCAESIRRPGAAASRVRRHGGSGRSRAWPASRRRSCIACRSGRSAWLARRWRLRGTARAAMRTICSICCTLVRRSPFLPQKLSSMPTRTCRPIAMAIVFTGSTWRIRLSMVSTAPARHAADELHHVDRVRAVLAATDHHVVQDQRAGVDAAADQPLDGLELGDVTQHEVRLDAGGLQALQVLFDEGRAGGDRHLAVRGLQCGMRERGAGDVVGAHQLHDVHLVGVDGDRHLVGLGAQLGQHVARVVVQPLGVGALAFGGEGDRAADLQHHLRHRGAQAIQQFVEHRQALAALAVGLAAMHVQHGGAGVVAVHGLLHLLLHRHRDVVGIAGHVLGAVGGDLDHQGLLVFGQQGVVEELHDRVLSVSVDWGSGSAVQALSVSFSGVYSSVSGRFQLDDSGH